LFTPV